jgi:hypothetical protein
MSSLRSPGTLFLGAAKSQDGQASRDSSEVYPPALFPARISDLEVS